MTTSFWNAPRQRTQAEYLGAHGSVGFVAQRSVFNAAALPDPLGKEMEKPQG